METRNCVRCGRIFMYTHTPVCGNCLKEEENDVQKVRAYIKENPGCTIDEVAEATDISSKRITRFIREERIEVVQSAAVLCERCGKAISTGRYCKECQSNLIRELEGAKRGMKTKAEREKEEKWAVYKRYRDK